MRQLQGHYGPLGKVTGIAPITKGGTGASTPPEAVANLGGLSVTELNQPNGPIQADANGHLPIEVLTAAGLSVGYTLTGPTNLVNGQTSVFQLTNWTSSTSVAVGISAGSVSITGDTLSIVAPSTGTSVTLTLGDRQLVLPVISPGSQTPVIVAPVADSLNLNDVVFMTAPFAVASEAYSDWVSLSGGTTTSVSIPTDAIGIEFEGRAGVGGSAYLTLSGHNYPVGTSTFRRRVDFSGQSTLSFTLSGTGSLKYRWITSTATHVATDWEVATDRQFTTLVAQSLNDSVNKTQWSTTLSPGSYFVRARFYANLSV